MSILILFFLISFIPVIWVNYVFKKNDTILPNMPFNGYEFGEQIIEELKLKNVRIEKTLIGDHYDLIEKKVKVHEDRFTRKSLTSISVICHEIGHAIQHAENYTPLITRTKLVENTQWINKAKHGDNIYWIPNDFCHRFFITSKTVCFNNTIKCFDWSHYTPYNT